MGLTSPAARAQQGFWSQYSYRWDCYVEAANPGAPGGTAPFPLSIKNAALIPVGPYRGWVALWVRYQPAAGSSDPLSATFLWNPEGSLFSLPPSGADPYELHKVVSPFGRELVGAAITWDNEGALILVGASGSFDAPGSETWRFFPAGLLYPPVLLPGFCQTKIEGRAWRQYDPMSVTRHGGVITALCREPIIPAVGQPGLPQVASASAWVIGGHAGAGPPTANDGLEFLQALSPQGLGGSSFWSQTYIPSAFGVHAAPPPPLLTETYTVVPPLTEVQFDSAAAAHQLSNLGTGTAEFRKSVLVGQDSETVLGASPSGSNSPGRNRVVRPRYQSAPNTASEMHQATSQLYDRTHGTAVLMHQQVGAQPYDGKNRYISIGGIGWYNVGGNFGWYSNLTAAEYRIPAGTNPTQGTWAFFGGTQQQQGWMDNTAVVLPTGGIVIVGGVGALGWQFQFPSSGNPRNDAGLILDPGVAGAMNWSASPIPPRPRSTIYVPPPGQGSCGCIPPRPFEHVSLLLPDGRVFVAGGIDAGNASMPERFSGEVYSPQYMTYPNRPSIVSIDGGNTDLTYGAADLLINVMRETHDTIDRLVLIRPGAISRGFDASQRYIELEISGPGPYEGGIEGRRFTCPNDDLGPPGFYMMFVVVTRLVQGSPVRIPSTAAWVRLKL